MKHSSGRKNGLEWKSCLFPHATGRCLIVISNITKFFHMQIKIHGGLGTQPFFLICVCWCNFFIWQAYDTQFMLYPFLSKTHLVLIVLLSIFLIHASNNEFGRVSFQIKNLGWTDKKPVFSIMGLWVYSSKKAVSFSLYPISNGAVIKKIRIFGW